MMDDDDGETACPLRSSEYSASKESSTPSPFLGTTGDVVPCVGLSIDSSWCRRTGVMVRSQGSSRSTKARSKKR